MRLLLALMLLTALGSVVAAQTPPPAGQTPLEHPGESTGTVPPEQFIPAAPPATVPAPQRKLAYCVVIDNRTDGVIRIIDPPAQFLLSRPGADIGKVVRPATQLNSESFHASLWGRPLTVVASAVNAIHIKAYDEATEQRAAVVTILPHELLTTSLEGQPSEARDDAIYTDIAGVHGIFGGAYPVITGNPVSVYRDGQHVYFDDENNAIKAGDIIIIEVRTPDKWPQALIIENHEAGAVTLTGADGKHTVCATVSKPVSGSGRFSGGVFSAPGGIRATHSGVLDIDFSPVGETGGLQLIPYAHSLSPELTYSQDSPPYGILLGVDMSDLRGQPPLFGGYLYPQSGLESSVKLPQLSVSVQYFPSTQWVPVPSVSGREDLSSLSGIRIDWVAAKPGAAAPATPPTPPPAPPVSAGPADQDGSGDQAPPGYVPVEPPGFRGGR